MQGGQETELQEWPTQRTLSNCTDERLQSL